eukprot:5486565-Alexandrium_andersonii.AAC.1
MFRMTPPPSAGWRVAAQLRPTSSTLTLSRVPRRSPPMAVQSGMTPRIVRVGPISLPWAGWPAWRANTKRESRTNTKGFGGQ